jgi:galactokinase/galacturonokinase
VTKRAIILVDILRLTERKLLEIADREVGPIRHVVAPYRICPLGAHVDHQGGPVLGRTINAYSVLAFSGTDRPEVTLTSGNFPGSASISLNDPGSTRDDHWDRYARGAAYTLAKNHRLTRGLVGFVHGTLPGSGLSSSASVGLAYIAALAAVNEISLELPQYVELDRQLENDYLGLQNGILDQTTILYGRTGSLLSIDTQQRSVTIVNDPPAASQISFVVFYSGFSRELTSTVFNQRVVECRQAANRLAQLAGLGDKQQLADIPASTWREHGHRLPDPQRRRAHHFFGAGS